MVFSSRAKLLIAGGFFVLASVAAMVYLQESWLIPRISDERMKLLEEFPVLLATSNQKAILTNDLATLSSTLKQVISNAEATGSDLRYVIMQDADGKILARMLTPRWDAGMGDKLLGALRGQGSSQTEGADSLKEIGATTPKSAEMELSLPPVLQKSKTRFVLADENILDLGVPLARGASTFGSVRVGVAEDHANLIAEARTKTAIVAVLLAVLFLATLAALYGNIESSAAETRAEAISRVRAEMQEKIKKLESAQEKAEEESPVAPSDLLALLDFARNVSAVLDYARVLEIAIETSLHTLGVRDASIFLLDAASNELVGKIGHDDRGMVYDDEMSRVRVPLGSGDIGAAAEFGTTTIINEPKPGTAVVAALVTRGRTIGVIFVRNKTNGRAFIKKDQTILRILAGILANAMDNAALFHHLGSRGGGLPMPST